MRLKRLEIFGFKSFADRTVFEFGDNTLTGVVGPNGCGKSNVVDSVRWVLGEQRPTSMRGSEMTDVIFKGSSSRPALSVAEVTLILDNQTSVLAGRGAEVAITRRVFKSGEGEYLLDGDKVRLKDVREMLFDTGLGSRGYSVLEQGKIDAVLSANPLERRRIFEEAAGISRYRQRKLETELRLKRVAEDMNRLDDVLGELGTRVRSLKIQAGKAERFVEARELWVAERTRLFKHQVWFQDRELEELAQATQALEQQGADLRTLRTGSEQDVDVRERERSTIESEVERLMGEASRLSGDGRAIDERRSQLAARAASWQAGAREEGERARALELSLSEREREIARLAHELEALGEQSARSSTSAEEQARALRAVEERHRELRLGFERQNQSVQALARERNQAENRVRQLSDARAPATQRQERLSERLQGAALALAAMRTDAEQAAAGAHAAHSAQEQQDKLRRELAERLAQVAAQAGTAEQEQNALELERARVKTRIEALLDRERDLEQLSAGARRLLEGVERSNEPCAPEALSGLVADHLRTNTRHARALDAVLGVQASALVARDLETARAVAGWLAQREGGQVGVVLPGGLAPHAPRSTVAGLRRLREHVRCDAGFEALADLLCADVYLADDVDQALALVSAHAHARCVTLEGEFVDAASLWVGHRTLTQGAVGRRASAAELGADVEALSSSIAALEARKAELVRERATLQQQWERASHDLEQRRQARAQAESAAATAQARVRDLGAAHALLEQEASAAEVDSARIEAELVSSREREALVQSKFESENQALSALEETRRELEADRERRSRDESEARLQATRARTELDGLKQRRADMQRVCAENKLELERAQRLCGEQRESAAQATLDCEALAQQSAAVLAQRGTIDERLSELRALAESGRGTIETLRKRVEAVTRELEQASETLAQRRLADQRLRLARAEIVRRAEEELSLSAQALAQDFEPEQALREPDALATLELEVREHRDKLDKLGPVNMEAMAELSEVGGRLEFLTRQRADLARARAALDETVATIDSESKRLFLETFATVRTNFQRIFRQLFGGGRAEVELEAGVDVLDAGVEIVARPPGRELLSIGLLSGGQRTLTALALLFAVFEARPSPFCILDEVDAALDDANVDRFLAMLDGFRQSTQFVIVTHNKGTMAACESLYGVTMETKGVSRQVSVELAQVDGWVARAGAESPAGADARSTNGVDAESGERAYELVPARGAALSADAEAERAAPAIEALESAG